MNLNKDLLDNFFENVVISDNEKEHAYKFLASKGIVKHILIKNHLLVWGEKDSADYATIASTYRYDKRLRAILFKYISYLEEFYRGKLLDKYYYSVDSFEWMKEVRSCLRCFDNDLNRALEKIDFKTLILQIRKEDALCKECFPNKKYLKSNCDALILLRNAVMHNKLLLLYKNFGKCFFDSTTGSSTLSSNIKNLINFLPNGPKEKCVEEINTCCSNRNDSTDCAWKLPSYLIVKI